MENRGFRHKGSIHIGLGIFYGCDADCAIYIGDYTKEKSK